MIKTTQTCSCNLANKSFLFQNVPCMRIFVSVYNQSAILQCLSGTLEKTHKNSHYDQQQLIDQTTLKCRHHKHLAINDNRCKDTTI